MVCTHAYHWLTDNYPLCENPVRDFPVAPAFGERLD